MMLTSSRTGRRTAAVAAAAVLALGLTACSDSSEDSSDSSTSAETTESAGGSAAATPAENSSDASGSEENGPLSAEPTEGLADGDVINVTLTGLDTAQGYYLGICSAEDTAGGPPNCTGARDDSAWIAGDDEQRATDHFNAEGDARVELSVKATNEDHSLNCAGDDKCVLKLFGDHKAGFGNVAEVPVTFAD